jgi:cytochrome P450
MSDPDDPGYWAITRRDDIVAISRDSEMFLSGKGVLFENVPVELLEASQSFLAMDPPRHTFLSKLVSAAFTQRQVRRIEDSIQANANAIVEELENAGSGVDFVEHCAKELPIRTLSDMVGIPGDERQKVAHAADAMVSWADPVYLNGRPALEVLFEAQMYSHQVALRLGAQRREHPGDDLLSALVNAEVDGDRLADADVAAFFVLLSVAGNDTTRQTTSHAVKALTEHPDQRAWLLEDFDNRIGAAVEEFIRWATPVMTFRRTAAGHHRSRAGVSGRKLHSRHPPDALHVLRSGQRAAAGESSSASNVISSEHPPSTLTLANSSPRVGPRLTMATGMPRAAACRTKR